MKAEAEGARDLRTLIELAGGTALTSLPKVHTRGQDADASLLVLGPDNALPGDRAWAKETLKPGTAAHTREFLIHSIISQSLDRTKDILFKV